MFIMCYLGSCIISFLLQFSICSPVNKCYIFSRSKCKECQKTLKWWMMLPIFSFIFLKGKCYFCKKSIPKYLWIGEGLGGAVSYFTLTQQFEMYRPYLYACMLIFLSLSIIDIQYFVVPHRLLLLLLFLTIILTPQLFDFNFIKIFLISTLFLIGIVLQRYIGFGDIKLFILLSLILPLHFVIYVIWLTFPIATLTYPIFYYGFRYQKSIPLVPSIAIAFSIVAYTYPTINYWFGGL